MFVVSETLFIINCCIWRQFQKTKTFLDFFETIMWQAKTLPVSRIGYINRNIFEFKNVYPLLSMTTVMTTIIYDYYSNYAYIVIGLCLL